jgi:hypothetical protein
MRYANKKIDMIKIGQLFEDIEKYENPLDLELKKPFADFTKFKTNDHFTDEKTFKYDHFSFYRNPKNSDIQKSNILSMCISAKISRYAQDISKSKDTYKYTVGADSSINIGNSYNYTFGTSSPHFHNEKRPTSNNPRDRHYGSSQYGSVKVDCSENHSVKKSIHKGKKISMSIGDTTSKNTIKDNDSTINGKSFSIKDLTNRVHSDKRGGVYLSFTGLAKHFFNIYAPLAIDSSFGPLRLDMTIIPMKSHFTASQQIFSAVYGDFVHYENLARIFALSFTAYDTQEIEKFKSAVLTNSKISSKIEAETQVYRNSSAITNLSNSMFSSTNSDVTRSNSGLSVSSGTVLSI